MKTWAIDHTGWWTADQGERCTRLFHCWPELLAECSGAEEIVLCCFNRAVRLTALVTAPDWIPAEPLAHLLDASGRLEFRLAHWRYGLAVIESGPVLRHSLQFFDATHTGILKLIFPPGREELFHRLVRHYQWAELPPGQEAPPPTLPSPPISRAASVHLWPRLHRWPLRDAMTADPVVRRIELLASRPEFAVPVSIDQIRGTLEWWCQSGIPLELSVFTPGLTFRHRLTPGHIQGEETVTTAAAKDYSVDFFQEDTAVLFVVVPALPGNSYTLEAFDEEGRVCWNLAAADSDKRSSPLWNQHLTTLARRSSNGFTDSLRPPE
jgi:putative heme degradation protein